MMINIKIYIHLWHECLGNDKSSSRNFGDSSQLTNLILDSVAMCHMTPQV